MANGGSIRYTIGFDVDKTSLQQIQAELTQLSKLTTLDVQKMNPTMSIEQARKAVDSLRASVKEVQGSFQSAFDTKIGVLNLQKFQQSLKGLNLNQIQQSFAAIGPQGYSAFLKISQAALTMNVQLKQTNSLMNKMGTTLINTLKWTFSSSLINRFTGAVQKAVGYVEHLDSSLNDIRIVTKKSSEEMEAFAVSANNAAKALGKATTDYTEAALLYYQQGLSDEEVKARAETTLKAANVTGQATKTVSEQLTAVWNGFRVNAEQTEEYVDKLAAVAAMSASNLEELSTGMSKVASAASNLGVDIDQLSAQISTIVSVTRQAPESVGTALKTIYARISDLKLGESDEDGLGLGDVSGGLQKLGIEVLDAEGELRDLGTVIEEIAAKWNDWTSAQQAAIAQLMAGKRQYNNLVALFSNWDMYENAINTSRNATGELQKQQDIYMESTEAHLEQLKAQWEDMYDSLFDANTINTLSDALRGIISLLTKVIDTIGGGSTVITGLIGFVLNKFSPQITSQILMPFINNLQAAKNNVIAFQEVLMNARAVNEGWSKGAATAMAEAQLGLQKYWDVMTVAEQNESQDLIRNIGYWENQKTQIQANVDAVDQLIQAQTQIPELQGIGSILNIDDIDKEKVLDFLAEQSIRIDDIVNHYQDLKTAALNANKSLQLDKEVNTNKIVEMNYHLTQMKENLEQLKNSKIIDDNTFNLHNQKLQDLAAKLQECTQNGKDFEGFTATELADLRSLIGVLNRVNIGLEQHEKTTRNCAEAMGEATANTDANTNALEKNDYAIRKRAQATTQLIGGLTQSVHILQSTSNIFKTLFDSNIKSGEKFSKILTSIVFVAPMARSAIVGLSTALSNLTKKTIGTGVVGGILATIGAISSIISIIKQLKQSKLDKIADDAERVAESTQEAAKAAEEYTESLDKLNDKYQELNEQLKEHSINLGDAKTQIYNLCQEYGLQQLAIEILTTDYENLAESIRKAQDAAAERNLEAASKNSEALFNKAVAEANQGLGEGVLDFTGLGSRARQEQFGGFDYWNLSAKEFQRQNMYNDLIALGIHIDDWGQASTEDLIKTAATNAEALYEIVNKYDIKAASELSEFLKNNQNNIKAYKEAVEKEFTATAATIISPNDIQTVEDYNKAIEDLINNEKILINFNGNPQAAEDWAKSWLGSLNKVSKISQRANLENQLMTAGGWSSDEIFSRSDEELNFLFNNQALAKSKENLDEFFELYSNEINAAQNKSLAIQVSAVLASGEDGKKFSEDLVKNLFESTEIEQITGVSQEFFNTLDFEEQKQLLKDWTKESVLAYKTEADNWQKNFEQKKTEVEKLEQKVDQARKSAGFGTKGSFTTTQAGEEQYQNNLAIYGSEEAMIQALGQTSDMAKYSKFRQSLQEIGIAAGDVEEQIKEINALEAQWSNQQFLEEISASYAQTASNIEELEQAYKDGLILAIDFTAKYQELERARDLEGIDEKELSDYTNYLQEIAGETDELADGLEQDSEAAEVMAKSILKMNKGIEELSSNFEEWNDILQNSEKSSEEYYKAISGMRSAMAKLLDISEDYVSSNFLTSNLEDIGKAAEGDAEAIDRLRQALSQDVVANLVLKDEKFREQLTSTVTDLQSALDAADFSMTPTLENEAMFKALNEMIAAAGLSVDQVNALFDSMGYEANFESQEENIPAKVPVTTKYHEITGYKEHEDGSREWVETERTQTTYEDNIGKATAFALGVNAEPKIKSVAKKANGSFNNKSSSNPGGTKKSSGGGSKGSKGKEPSKEKPIERDTDIYRVVNQELSQVESQLSKIDKFNSNQWGITYAKTLEKQNTLLKKQTELLNKKNKLQVNDLATRRKQLEDIGIQFSEDGAVILNAEEYLNELYAQHNEKINAYNGMSASQQETAKADLETDKNRIDAIEKKLDEYESTYSDFQKTLEELQDIHFQEIENEVEQFNYMVDVHLELNDARKEWNDFWKEVVEDVQDNDFGGQIATSIKQLETLIGLNGDSSKSTVGLLTNQLNKTIEEVNKQIATADQGGIGSIYEDDSKLSKEDLTNRIDQLMSALRDAKAEVNAIGENYLKQLDEEQELIDKQANSWETIDKHIEHNVELIKILSSEKAFDLLDEQYQQQYTNNLNSITTQRIATENFAKKVEEYKKWVETAEEGSIEWQTASDAYDKAVEDYIKATQALDDAIIKALNDLKKQTENANAKVIDTLDKAMSKGLGLDLMEQEWKLINDEADKYYDNVERYLNMEEYTNILNDAANAIGLSAENQQKLNQFRDQELTQLNEKEKLTSYDIEESKARLEILKAQIALEDAQANKSKMRLRRDSQGNYNYQYVADENAVNDGENGVLTAKKSWYEIVKKRYQETSNDIIEIQKQQLELANQIKDAESQHDIERLNKLKELYDSNEKYREQRMAEAEKNKRDLYNGTAQYFANVENASILPQSEATVRKLIDEWAGSGSDSFVTAVTTAITELDAVQAKFVKDSDEIMTTSGRNYEDLKNKIDPTINSLKELAGTNDELATKIDDVNQKLNTMADNLRTAEQGYNNLKNSAVEALRQAETSLNQLANTYIQTQQKMKAAADAARSASPIPYTTGTTSTSSSGSASGGNNTTSTYNANRYMITITDDKGGHYTQSTGTKDELKMIARVQANTMKKQVTVLDTKTKKTLNLTPDMSSDTIDKKIKKFKTGGYTGEWGAEGRLGILHQKELVLNENDTKNMLSAVQILRSIPYSTIAQSLLNSSRTTAVLSSINSGISGLSTTSNNSETKTMIVNADFSGVHDADEIYKAFLELENYGLQNSYSVAPHANTMY